MAKADYENGSVVMDGRTAPCLVDTVIIGTGPSAMILSYILNGYQPHLRTDTTHPDPQLQAKLAGVSSLLGANFQHLSAHFPASRFSYSTQALPINTLLDTLLRPLGDTAPGLHPSCIEWRPTQQKVDHLVLGIDHAAGGQWQENPVASSANIPALSYADLLTLPGYTMVQHLHERGVHDDMGFLRPTRRDVAEYLTIWPHRVGIESSLRLGREVQGVERTSDDGFYIASHELRCRRIVLATGTFTSLIPPRDMLQPLLHLKAPGSSPSEAPPILVIGSGFSAADIILTRLPQQRRVLHLFKWDASDITTPLRACHPSAYPEYAGVFRRMKRAATEALTPHVNSPAFRGEMQKRRKSSTSALERPEWDSLYEGLPNARIHAVNIRSDNTSASILLDRPGGGLMEREISGLQYVIGRRGSLAYLDREIRAELLGPNAPNDVIDMGRPIQARALRAKVEQTDTLEMATSVFVIGSLLGDSLVRHAYGGCVVVARELLHRQDVELPSRSTVAQASSSRSEVAEVPTSIRAASEEVAEAVALAFAQGNSLPATRQSTEPSFTNDETNTKYAQRSTTYDPFPISLEFSEPPTMPWPTHYPEVDANVVMFHNDHERLGEQKHAILGNRAGAWCECSEGDCGSTAERYVPTEEVTAF